MGEGWRGIECGRRHIWDRMQWRRNIPYPVIPAKAGIQLLAGSEGVASWAPAFAGVTEIDGLPPEFRNSVTVIPEGEV